MASSPSSNPIQQSSDSSPPPPPDSSSPPPPSDSSPPPPSDSSPPPPSDSSPPPPSPDNSKSPPPPSPSSQPPPPPSKQKSPPPPPPPPPPRPQKNSHSRYSPPPPISHSHKTPSSSKSKSSSHSSSSSLTSNKNLVVGVVAGAALLLLVMVALVCCCCCKKKKKRKHLEQMTYFGNNAAGNKTNQYYNKGQHGNWNNPNPYGDHAVKMPPPPAYVNSSEWQAVPPPPPPPISSEMSSTGFSGSYQAPLPPPHPSLSLGFNNSTFTYEDLSAATGGFAKQNLLGQGGFGYVHKGVLPNGKEIAVKSLKMGSGQGDREFHAEVDIISRVHHRHLVSLVGYCIADSKRLLVYEFVPNGTLEYHLHGNGVPSLDFETRLKIALGSAKGFAYLHEDCHPRIIHRDIKAANILLDFNYEAKVADFGLAKLSNDNYTHVSTRIMGTFGYLAPEYASSGKLTEKSDVYSYGVVLLELITGRRPVDVNNDEDDNLVDWARPILTRATEGGSFEALVDPRLRDDYNPQQMMRMVACAAACIKHSARRRPKMSQIVRALEDDVPLDDLNAAVKLGHSGFESGGSDSYDSSTYHSQMRGFRKSSQDFTSSEHGASTGEFAPRRSPFSVGDSQELRSNRTHSP